jgi:hypothetical protein
MTIASLRMTIFVGFGIYWQLATGN